MNKQCKQCKHYGIVSICIHCDSYYENDTEFPDVFECKNPTPVRDMLKED